MNGEEVLRFPKPKHVCDTVPKCPTLTVLYWPPERIWATDLAMDGFSATHKTRMYYVEVAVGFPGDVGQGGMFAAG